MWRYWTTLLSTLVVLCLQPSQAASVVSTDITQLVDLADYASLAYCVNKGLKTGLLHKSCSKPFCTNHENVDIVKVFNFNDLDELGQGYYALDHDRNLLVLAFRGTSSYKDWIQDFDIVQVPYKSLSKSKRRCNKCKIHRGFYNFLSTNGAAIIKEVKMLVHENPHYKLVVVGHSLGGALAHLTALEFQIMGYTPLLVTFGAPMVGNLEFAKYSNLAFQMDAVASSISSKVPLTCGHIRVVHIRDPVPHQPLVPSYSYSGYEYFINKESFPHGPGNIERKGMKTGSSVFAASDWNPSKMLPTNPFSAAHRSYFRTITGCKDE